MINKVLSLVLAFVFSISIVSAAYEAPSDSTKPVASFTANVISGSAPLVVLFTDTSAGAPTSWYWDFGDGVNSKHAQTATHTFTNSGTYTVTLTVTNDAGSDMISKTNYITVYSTSESLEPAEVTEKPTATFTADVTTGYAPFGVQFISETTGNPTSYYWIFEPETSDDWNSHHPVTAVHTFKSPGVYTVSLVVTNSAGSYTVTKPNYITVLSSSTSPSTQKPTASFTANVNSGKAPLTVTFTDTSAGGVPTSWYWNFGDGTNSADAKTTTHTFTNPGTYTVTLTVTTDAGSDRASKTDYITVSAASESPIANFYSTQVQQAVASGEPLSVPATVSFTDYSTGSPDSWLWDFGDGGTSIGQNPTHTYVEAGNYTVKLTVSNSAGSNSIFKSGYVSTVIKEQKVVKEQPAYTPKEKPVSPSASVNLHGEKTSVLKGEDILLKLSAVNFITKPTMHVQAIIIPPSGMSVSSSEFVESGAGQYTTEYVLEPGKGRDIEVRIAANQVGDFTVTGKVIYYFGNNKKDGEYYTLDLPIHVEDPNLQPATPEPTSTSTATHTFNITPGFGVATSLVLILMIIFLLKRN